ncbi:MAG: response regulator [Crocinitomicaceae bacterium]|nr:response regulator [Crocinitomicaceae bacterium]
MLLNQKIQALIVDDDPLTNAFNKALLSRNDSFDDIVTITSGEDALQFLKNQLATTGSIPDVILVDVYMPNMDGFEFIEKLDHFLFKHEKEKEIEVNILSSTSIEEDILKFVQSSLANKFILKPLNDIKLEELIKRIETRRWN